MGTRHRTPPSETKTYLSPSKNAAAAALKEISDRFHASGGLEVTVIFLLYSTSVFVFPPKRVASRA